MGRTSVLLFLLSSATAWAQGVKLEARHGAAGDKAQVSITSALDLDMTVKDSEGEHTIQASQFKTEKFSTNVTSVEDGAGLVMRVTCATSEVQRSGTSGFQKENTALHGRTFVVKRGSSTTVELEGGGLAPSEADSLGGWEDFARLLPSKEVEVGAQWNIDKDVSALLSAANMADTKSALITCTLKSVEGSKATISFKGDVEGKTKDDMQIKISITEAEMVFDMTRGRPDSIKIFGSLEASKDIIRMYVKPGGIQKSPEKVGEIKAKSRKLEVKINFQ